MPTPDLPQGSNGLRPPLLFKTRTSLALRLMQFAQWLAYLIAPWLKEQGGGSEEPRHTSSPM